MLNRLAAAALLLVPLPAAAQALSPAEAQAIETIVAASLGRTGVPSASVAVVRGGKLVYAHAWGKASERIARATPALPYQIASNSKQFTAAAILLLQRDGKLSLDDTVAKYLPGQVTEGDRITIRQLLSHTSGLQDYWPQDYSFADMARPVTPAQIVARWGSKPLDFQPGTQWQYSNTGYVVAGLIVEKVAGQPLLSLLQQRIFSPLGITAIDQDLAVGPAYPQGYQRFALGPVRVERPAARGWLFAAGELAMSAPDLARWDVARMDRTVLDPADWAAQETTIHLADGSDSHYGLGVTTGVLSAHRFVEHSGEAVGFLTENYVFPDDRTAVVVFTNADFSGAYSAMAKDIARLVLHAPAEPAQPAGAAGEPAEVKPQVPAAGEEAKTLQAQLEFDRLRDGALDRRTMTANSNYYFTPVALGDYKASLSSLGRYASFSLARPPRLRGGFVNRNYTVSYPGGRKLSVVTYAEPGPQGRYEQFLVMPAE